MNFHASLALTAALSLFASTMVFAADAPKKPAAAPAEKPAASKPVALPDPVAVVEGVEIKKAELDQAFGSALASQGMPADQATSIPETQRMQFYRMLLDDMIVDKLISKRAAEETVSDKEIADALGRIRKNFGSDQEMEKQLEATGQSLDKVKENIRKQLRAQHWVDAQTKGKDGVSDADAEKFYSENPDKFKRPEQVRASHILISTPADAKPEAVVEKQKTAQAVLARVNKGEDFATLAKELSEDPTARQNSGDLDFFARDTMVKEFADVAFAMKKDEVSKEPVRSQFGYHIIKVTDHRDAETIALDKAKPQVLAFLQRQKKQEAVQTLVKDIRAKADVKVNLPEAPAPPPEK